MPTNTELKLKVDAKVVALIAEAISGRVQTNNFDAGQLQELKDLSTEFVSRVNALNNDMQVLT